MSKYTIITRHKGLVEWLKQHGIEGEVIEHVTPEQIKNKDVFGVLPLNLAALANLVTVVDLPLLKPEQRGVDLTPEEMDQAGAVFSTYLVRKV